MTSHSKNTLDTLLVKLRNFFTHPSAPKAMLPPSLSESLMLNTTPFTTLADFACYYKNAEAAFKAQELYQGDLINGEPIFTAPGFCFPCGTQVDFLIDYLYSGNNPVAGVKIPNWRERVICPQCGLNNRIRASVQFLEDVLGCKSKSAIYMSEQTTPLYQHLQTRYANLVGSEYLGDRIGFGTVDKDSGLRNESITKLSFPGEAFDFVMSFDVFEHIPEYYKALQECFRVLKPGGRLLFTVPFRMDLQANLVRATMDEQGNVTHLMEPEYHGDPISEAGCLCFYHFGWQLLDELKDCGFASAAAHLYWSDKLGYLGQNQVLFCAVKARWTCTRLTGFITQALKSFPYLRTHLRK